MRTIKFRGKSCSDGDWFYGNLYDYDKDGRTHICGLERGCLNIDPNTVGQFTGLVDKDGKEIFEGDVIQDDYYNKHLIQYDEQEACFVACLLPITKFSSRGNVSQNWINEFDKVVIGNIHDNPELIEKGE
ncbi:MAG: hypothetical protein IIT61_03135 [Bacteroidales bacterium]|nr:hypothetical protein [Bacteroidales bacterium]MBQ2350840.1 hypothetical protein [Bacteroidales bacterium]MBQ2573142.1 hypothetical protein [Bacteroidales bacterium]MBQ5423957.1 hypothetical protein [Bacteroidales bacterium]MBQ5457697.1 hypothetical protein [Bacteroidales bacterium]